MYKQTVTITTSQEFNTIEELNYAGGAMLALDQRFDDVFYHHYLINNNIIGEKTLNSSTSMTIIRNNVSEEQKEVLEKMYQAAKSVYLDNGWDTSWTFE